MAIRRARTNPKQSIADNLANYCFERENSHFDGKARGAAQRFLAYRPTGTIVDLGAGDGAAIAGFDGRPVVAVDINMKKLGRIQPPTKLVCQDFLTYLKGKQVDNVFCHHALEHCPNPRTVIRAIYRALKSGGLAFIAVPKEDGPHSVHHSSFSEVSDLLPTGEHSVIDHFTSPEELWVVWRKA